MHINRYPMKHSDQNFHKKKSDRNHHSCKKKIPVLSTGRYAVSCGDTFLFVKKSPSKHPLKNPVEKSWVVQNPHEKRCQLMPSGGLPDPMTSPIASRCPTDDFRLMSLMVRPKKPAASNKNLHLNTKFVCLNIGYAGFCPNNKAV